MEVNHVFYKEKSQFPPSSASFSAYFAYELYNVFPRLLYVFPEI